MNIVFSLCGHGKVLADAMVVLEHLFIGAHVEVSIESVKVAIRELAVGANSATHFNRVARCNVLARVISTWVETSDCDLFLYRKSAMLAD